MNWFRNLFAERKQKDLGPSEVAVRAAEIRSRIAAFKKNYPWSESLKSTPKPKVEVTKEPLKSEADILKAKLLGKKL